MNSVRIKIVNPKAVKLLEDLAAMDLITIQTSSSNEFSNTLKRLRSNGKSAPSLDEITRKVEKVRTKRYAKTK